MELIKGRSRIFIAALIGLVFVLLQQFVPFFAVTEDSMQYMGVLLMAYIFGEGISGRTFNDSVIGVLKSNKFQALVAGIIITIARGLYPQIVISETEMLGIIGIFVSLIVSMGFQKPIEPAG